MKDVLDREFRVVEGLQFVLARETAVVAHYVLGRLDEDAVRLLLFLCDALIRKDRGDFLCRMLDDEERGGDGSRSSSRG